MKRKLILVLTAILLVFCLVFAACGETSENPDRGSGSEAGSGQTTPDKKDPPADSGNKDSEEKPDEGDDKKNPPADSGNKDDEEKPDTGNENPDTGDDQKQPDSGDSEEKPDTGHQNEGKEDEETPSPTSTLTFEKSGNGYFVTGDAGESAIIVIPAAYENLPVIGIKESAFAYSKHTADITSVTIPDSVVTIEKNAFYSRQELKEVKIGEGSKLETIENNVFSGCRALEAIYLPAGLSSLGDSVFNNCGGLNTITVASGNTHYSGEGNCLIDLATHTLICGSNQSKIPSTVTKIGDAAFRRATLTTLSIPASVIAIGKYIIQDSAITTITYGGTEEAWNNAIKDTAKSWNMGKKDVTVTFSSQGQENTGDTDEKAEVSVLVVYFSCTNNTEKIAKYISEITGGTLYEITPEVPYTSDDLNYSNSNSRSTKEQNDDSARPAIKGTVENMEQYDTLYLGYPIWWGEAPKIIYTFLEAYDLSGKTIIPFCTSGSSGIGSSATHLHSLASGAKWQDGMRFSGSSQKSEVEAWIKDLKY